MKIGTKAKQKYTSAPISVPRTAVPSSFALVMRWNTSCCGIDPNANAKNAPAIVHQAAASPAAGKKSNLPSAEACAITFEAPPAMSPTRNATSVSPIRITTVCSRSVNATDHMPPKIV